MSGFDWASLARLRRRGTPAGITSVCTAHPVAIEAALLQGMADGVPVLIEATCNQVNQEGGYTGMTPAAFRRFVEAIAIKVGFDRTRLILGGDHLGPNPWKQLPAEAALERAARMVEAYAEAGFTKLHLDTSMGCLGEAAALPDQTTASRAAMLAGVAERVVVAEDSAAPVYVIGTEVPIPGGALEALDHLQVTRPEAALRTVEVHRVAFGAAGLEAAFGRVVGIVVQPGVEFGNTEVIGYRPDRAASLSGVLFHMPQFVFEAHSTDYQSRASLRALVNDGFAILKVGPGLTFALREAFYGLDHIADVLDPQAEPSQLRGVMDRLMLAEPDNWRSYTEGHAADLFGLRHFGYSDRIRYYWPRPQAQAAVARLIDRLGARPIPQPLISQYLPCLDGAVRDGEIEPRPHALMVASVRAALAPYSFACSGA